MSAGRSCTGWRSAATSSSWTSSTRSTGEDPQVTAGLRRRARPAGGASEPPRARSPWRPLVGWVRQRGSLRGRRARCRDERRPPRDDHGEPRARGHRLPHGGEPLPGRAPGAGAIVNVSSHQAARPVRGALPYATAKAAVEGLTRAGRRRPRPGRDPHQRRRPRVGQHGRATRPTASSTRRSTRRWRPCTRSAGSAPRRRSRRRSPTCCPTTRASSTAWCCPVDGGRAAQGSDPEAV